MPGIIVGIDGSGHSQLALDWACGRPSCAENRSPSSPLCTFRTGWHGMVVFLPVRKLWLKRGGGKELPQGRRQLGEAAVDQGAGRRRTAGRGSDRRFARRDLLVLGSRGAAALPG